MYDTINRVKHYESQLPVQHPGHAEQSRTAKFDKKITKITSYVIAKRRGFAVGLWRWGSVSVFLLLVVLVSSFILVLRNRASSATEPLPRDEGAWLVLCTWLWMLANKTLYKTTTTIPNVAMCITSMAVGRLGRRAPEPSPAVRRAIHWLAPHRYLNTRSVNSRSQCRKNLDPY